MYKIDVKSETGQPIEGLRLSFVKSDLGTLWNEGKIVKKFDGGETRADGTFSTYVEARLTQHWKGGYYEDAEIEKELGRQPFPHGGTDIWGYFTEMGISGPGISRRTLTFTQETNESVAVPLKFTIPAPDIYGKSSTHKYVFAARDKDGKAVGGGKIYASFTERPVNLSNKVFEEVKSCTTDESGRCSISFPTKTRIQYLDDFSSAVVKNGFGKLQRIAASNAYFGNVSGAVVRGQLGEFFVSERVEAVKLSLGDGPVDVDPIGITIPTPRDYFCASLKDPQQSGLATKLESWVREIKDTGEVRNSELVSICKSEFKGKNYVALQFLNKTKYNELKLNNYGIGTIVFDDVIRKLLSPIISASINLPIDGYKLSVATQKSNFIDKASPSEILTYDFFMPRELVKQYKDSDISGQKLVNGSIVLLNGERIDLELK